MRNQKIYQLLNKNREVERKFEVTNKSDDIDELYVYDFIGEFMGMGVSAEKFAKTVRQSNAQEIHIRINSPGGSVFDGRAMAAALADSKIKTIAYVDGICASAATTIAVACDEVVMAKGSEFMIHNSWTIAGGDKNDLLKVAESLENIDKDIASDYADKTGIDIKDVKQMMDDETWLNADSALEKGFADSIAGESIENQFDLSVYDHAPEEKNVIKALAEPEVKPEVKPDEPEVHKASPEVLARMAQIRINQISR